MRTLVFAVICTLLICACGRARSRETPGAKAPKLPGHEKWRKAQSFNGIDDHGRAAILSVHERVFIIAAGSHHGVRIGENVRGVFDYRPYGTFDKYALQIVDTAPHHSVAVVVFITTWPRYAEFEDTHYIQFERPEAPWLGSSDVVEDPSGPGHWREWDEGEMGVVIGEITKTSQGACGTWLLLFKLTSRYVPEIDEVLAIPDASGDVSRILKVVRRYHVDDDVDKPVEALGCEVVGELKVKPVRGMEVVSPRE